MEHFQSTTREVQGDSELASRRLIWAGAIVCLLALVLLIALVLLAEGLARQLALGCAFGLMAAGLLLFLGHRQALGDRRRQRAREHEARQALHDKLQRSALRRQELEDLRERQSERLALLGHQQRHGFWSYDPQRDRFGLDESAVALIGGEADRLRSWREAWNALGALGSGPFADFSQRLLEQGEEAACELELQLAEGHERMLVTARPSCAHGELLAVEGCLRSIGEMHELRDDRDRLGGLLVGLLALSSEAWLVCDAQGAISRFNPAMEELSRWSRHRAVGKRLGEVLRLLDPQTRETLESPLARALRRRLRHRAEDAILLDRQGNEHRVAVSAMAVHDQDGHARSVIIGCVDVSSRLRLEERFRQAQKMETIGRLVGGIAHDFNNLLCGILGYADRLLRELEVGSPSRQRAAGILEAAGRASELTRRLLDCARRGRRRNSRVGMHRMIDEVVGILRHTVGPQIAIETACLAEHDSCEGDPAQLQSALLNLAVNARDAMGDGGTLRISTGDAVYTEEDLPASSMKLRPGRYLLVHVADTGIGMDQVVQNKIFEPFFTTKAAGKGTGLGLPAVFGCMQEHGGAVTLRSALGEGSIFTLHLPVIESDAESSIKRVRTARIGRGECILVVDDEEFVRQMAEDLLVERGYEVICAADGKEALEQFRGAVGRIKLVLLDMVMPRMNGTTTRSRLREIDPSLPIIICSGCHLDEARDAHYEGPPCGYLQKPFDAEELHRAVDEQFAASVGS